MGPLPQPGITSRKPGRWAESKALSLSEGRGGRTHRAALNLTHCTSEDVVWAHIFRALTLQAAGRAGARERWCGGRGPGGRGLEGGFWSGPACREAGHLPPPRRGPHLCGTGCGTCTASPARGMGPPGSPAGRASPSARPPGTARTGGPGPATHTDCQGPPERRRSPPQTPL